MRRLSVILVASLLVLGGVAAPASAKRDKPGQPAPTLAFGHPVGGEPFAEYQPDFGLCVADVYVQVERGGNRSTVTFEASTADGTVSYSQDQTLPRGGLMVLLFSYDFPCDSEIQLDVTHIATLKDRKGKELASVQETHTMDFVVHR